MGSGRDGRALPGSPVTVWLRVATWIRRLCIGASRRHRTPQLRSAGPPPSVTAAGCAVGMYTVAVAPVGPSSSKENFPSARFHADAILPRGAPQLAPAHAMPGTGCNRPSAPLTSATIRSSSTRKPIRCSPSKSWRRTTPPPSCARPRSSRSGGPRMVKHLMRPRGDRISQGRRGARGFASCRMNGRFGPLLPIARRAGVGVPNRCVSGTRGSAETSLNELRKADCSTPPQILLRPE